MSNDGGPAFPRLQAWQADSYGQASNTAYKATKWVGGMSLRDYFAAVALQGLCAEESHLVGMDRATKYEQIAKRAYLYADAMLRERDK